MNYRRAKFLVIIFGLVALLYFTNDFQLIDIEKTAIIVELGVDYDNNEYQITAQIAVPQAGDYAAGNTDAVITSSGKTVYEGIEKIAQQSGWYPELSFCNLILFGKGAHENAVGLAEYFLTSSKFQNSAVLAACEQTASEVLKSTTPLDFVSSFALQKILLRNVNRANSVMLTDVKSFCADNYSVSSFCYLPLIQLIETDDKQKDDGNNQGNQGGNAENSGDKSAFSFNKNYMAAGNGSAGGGSAAGKNNEDSEKKRCVFDARNSLLYSNGKIAASLNGEQTLCYNLLFKQVHETFISLSGEKSDSENDRIYVAVVNNYSSVNLRVKNGVPMLDINLKLVCKREEQDASTQSDLSNPSVLSEKELKRLTLKMQKTVNELISLSKSTECDFLRLKENLYRRLPEHYHALKDGVIKNAVTRVSVKCINYN